MERAVLRAVVWPAGLAAAGAGLVCWGLALGGYWPVAFALGGQRALSTAGTVLALGVLLAAMGGALLAVALVAALRCATTAGRSVLGSEGQAPAPAGFGCPRKDWPHTHGG